MGTKYVDIDYLREKAVNFHSRSFSIVCVFLNPYLNFITTANNIKIWLGTVTCACGSYSRGGDWEDHGLRWAKNVSKTQPQSTSQAWWYMVIPVTRDTDGRITV
jgi:hypothetical protein